MSNLKKVYIVWGNQDGNVGVFTNKKLAYEKCVEYMSYHPEVKLFSYSKFCKNINKSHYSFIHDDRGIETNAEAKTFYLNR